MNYPKGLIFILLFGAVFAFGCDGCYDNDLSNYVSSPKFSHVRGTNYLIEMTSSTDGASIKYTVDGSDPKTSSSAVQGTSVTIDFFTEIKAYAYKEDMIDSQVVCYRVPTFSRTTYIKYKTNGNVDYYSYSELDGNENKVIEVKFSGRGSDLTWFTDDDVKSQYTLFQYNATGMTEEIVFGNAGTDNEWFTSDDGVANYYTYDNNTSGKPVTKIKYNTADVMQAYWTYEYSGANLSFMREFDADDNLTAKTGYLYNMDGTVDVLSKYDLGNESTVLSHINHTYTGGRLDTAIEILDLTSDIISYSAYYYDNIEEYSVCQYDLNDKLISQTKYKGYGTDTGFGLIEYTYNTGGNLLTKTEYEDIYKNNCRLYTEYSYSGSLQREVCYTTPLKDEKLYSYNYSYSNGKLSRKEKMDSDDATLLEYTDYEYNGNSKKIKEIIYKHPDPNSMTISFNLEISAGYINSGYYATGGANFSHEGDPVSGIIDIDPDVVVFVNSVIDKLETVYNNLEITDNGIIIHGSKAGDILITVRVVNNVITVKYCFNGYDDGDMIVNGQIIKTLQGTIDLTGNLSGSLNGTLTGSLVVTDADPAWTAEEFLKNSYTVFEYNSASGLLEKAKSYADPGMDGEWDTADDNLSTLTTYTYDASDYLTVEQIFNNFGADKAWETGDDVLDYHLNYSYSGANIDKIEKYREYGTYMKYFTGAGVDSDWLDIDDNDLGYS